MNNPSTLAKEFMNKGFSLNCPIIDVHGHLGPFWGVYMPSADINLMIRTLKRCGVRRIVCVPHAAMVDPQRGNELMQKTIDKYKGIFLGYWMINPNHPDIIEKDLQNFANARRFVGFKFIADYHTYPITGENYIPALEYANEKKLMILVHTWGGSQFDSPKMLGRIAEKYSNINFVMGHSGFGDWETSVQLAKELPNVYLELTAVWASHDFTTQAKGSGTPVPLSSFLHINGIIEFMVERAGSKKILFGTDLPWYSPHYAAGAILFSHITDEERHDIFHRNAERLLNKFL